MPHLPPVAVAMELHYATQNGGPFLRKVVLNSGQKLNSIDGTYKYNTNRLCKLIRECMPPTDLMHWKATACPPIIKSRTPKMCFCLVHILPFWWGAS